jgi:hypothetical protein
MSRLLTLASVAVLLAGCTAALAPAPEPVQYQPVTPPVDEAKIQREGDVLLAKWTTCRTDAARDLAKTKIPTEEVPIKANEKCHAEREAWVDSQVSPGVSRAMAETVADGSEHCLYTIQTGYVGMLRSGASSEDIKLWALTRKTPASCSN